MFFYIDPDYAEDPALENMDNVLLSYTFFDTKSNVKLPRLESFGIYTFFLKILIFSPFERPKDKEEPKKS